MPDIYGLFISGVTTTLAGLRADKVDADFKCLLYVLGVPNHVHDEDASFVEFVDGPLGRNTDCGDEEGGALLDDNFKEIGELAIGVIRLLVVQLSSVWLKYL